VSLILDRLAQAFDPSRPEALLIGGQALPLYGVERQTVDVDCLTTPDAVEKLAGVLRAAGYEEAGRSETVIRYRHASPLLADVDLMLVSPETYDNLLRESQEWRIEQTVWRVPALPHLIALKLHALKNNPQRRERDLPDIRNLLRLNPGVVPQNALRDLCEKFGPPGIFSKLAEAE
jgi:hypothetical protein